LLTKNVVGVYRVDNANSSARAAPTGQVGPTDQDQDQVGPTDIDNDVEVAVEYEAVEYESEDNCSSDDNPGEASTLPTPHFLHVFSGSLAPQLSTQLEIRLLNQRQTRQVKCPRRPKRHIPIARATLHGRSHIGNSTASRRRSRRPRRAETWSLVQRCHRTRQLPRDSCIRRQALAAQVALK
jgi:hypothetical protein